MGLLDLHRVQGFAARPLQAGELNHLPITTAHLHPVAVDLEDLSSGACGVAFLRCGAVQALGRPDPDRVFAQLKKRHRPARQTTAYGFGESEVAAWEQVSWMKN